MRAFNHSFINDDIKDCKKCPWFRLRKKEDGSNLPEFVGFDKPIKNRSTDFIKYETIFDSDDYQHEKKYARATYDITQGIRKNWNGEYKAKIIAKRGEIGSKITFANLSQKGSCWVGKGFNLFHVNIEGNAVLSNKDYLNKTYNICNTNISGNSIIDSSELKSTESGESSIDIGGTAIIVDSKISNNGSPLRPNQTKKTNITGGYIKLSIVEESYIEDEPCISNSTIIRSKILGHAFIGNGCMVMDSKIDQCAAISGRYEIDGSYISGHSEIYGCNNDLNSDSEIEIYKINGWRVDGRRNDLSSDSLGFRSFDFFKIVMSGIYGGKIKNSAIISSISVDSQIDDSRVAGCVCNGSEIKSSIFDKSIAVNSKIKDVNLSSQSLNESYASIKMPDQRLNNIIPNINKAKKIASFMPPEARVNIKFNIELKNNCGHDINDVGCLFDSLSQKEVELYGNDKDSAIDTRLTVYGSGVANVLSNIFENDMLIKTSIDLGYVDKDGGHIITGDFDDDEDIEKYTKEAKSEMIKYLRKILIKNVK